MKNLLFFINNTHNQWYFVLIASILFFSFYYIKKDFGLSSCLLFLYTLSSGLWVWAWQYNRYITVAPYDQQALRYFACDQIAKLMIVFVPMIIASKNKELMMKWGRNIILIFVFSNIVMIYAQYFYHGCVQKNSCGGIVGNPSISLSLMVCMLPFIITKFKNKFLANALFLSAVILSKSSIAMGLFIIYCFMHYINLKSVFLSKANVIKFFLSCYVCVNALLLSLYSIIGPQAFNSSDRFMIWQYMIFKWAVPWNMPFGTGLGTYHVFSINLQKHGKIGLISDGLNWWNTLHNDWLQMLFETGFVGLILLIWFYLCALKNACKLEKPYTRDSIILFGVFMTLNPAIHWAYSSLFGAWLFIYALRKK